MLQTVADVIDALGGPKAAAEVTKRSTDSIYKWRKENKLPFRHYYVLNEALSVRRSTAVPENLWTVTK